MYPSGCPWITTLDETTEASATISRCTVTVRCADAGLGAKLEMDAGRAATPGCASVGRPTCMAVTGCVSWRRPSGGQRFVGASYRTSVWYLDSSANTDKTLEGTGIDAARVQDSWQTSMWTLVPDLPRNRVPASCVSMPSVTCPSIATSTSPRLMPARSAGPLCRGAITMSLLLEESFASSRPTPCSSPSDDLRYSSNMLHAFLPVSSLRATGSGALLHSGSAA
jgi:hypothetical protein